MALLPWFMEKLSRLKFWGQVLHFWSTIFGVGTDFKVYLSVWQGSYYLDLISMVYWSMLSLVVLSVSQKLYKKLGQLYLVYEMNLRWNCWSNRFHLTLTVTHLHGSLIKLRLWVTCSWTYILKTFNINSIIMSKARKTF